ncbi:MAG: PAS domain-containing protein [Candidatus Cloacimonadales bacterium]
MKKQIIYIGCKEEINWSDFAGFDESGLSISQPIADLTQLKKQFLRTQPELLLLDLDTLEDDNLKKICTFLRANCSLPIFLLSHKSVDEQLIAKELCNFAGYLKKPLNFVTLPIILQSKLYELALADALKKSDATTNALLNVSSDLAMVTDINGKILYANNSLSEFLQRPIYKLINRRCSEILDQQLFAQRNSYIERAFSKGEEVSFIDNYQARVYDNRIYPVLDRSGQVIRVALYSRDVTEDHVARARNIQLLKALETMQLGVTILDMDGKIRYCNKAEAQMHGYLASELLGKSASIFRPDDHPLESIDEIKQHYHGLARESVNLKKNGERFPVRVISDLVLNAEGKPFAMVTTCEDISKQKQMEAQLLRNERLAGVGNLSAGIAHEIRNPLGNISSAAQFCLNHEDLAENIKVFLDIILRNTEHANKIITELVDFANPRETEKKPEQINDVLDKAIAALHSKFQAATKQLICEKTAELPLLMLDAKWLQQAFEYIIDNAADAIEAGGWLKIVSQKVENQICVSFADNGCGIPEENLDKIFDPFFTTKDEGVGLGLPTLNSILTEHKAKLQIESEENIGTKITICFPKIKNGGIR